MATTVYYRLGEVALLVAEFTDADGNLVKPTGSITFTLKKPDGTTTSYTLSSNPDKLIEDLEGRYYVAWLTEARGPYEWDVTGTGTNAGSAGGKFRVQ